MEFSAEWLQSSHHGLRIVPESPVRRTKFFHSFTFFGRREAFVLSQDSRKSFLRGETSMKSKWPSLIYECLSARALLAQTSPCALRTRRHSLHVLKDPKHLNATVNMLHKYKKRHNVHIKKKKRSHVLPIEVCPDLNIVTDAPTPSTWRTVKDK